MKKIYLLIAIVAIISCFVQCNYSTNTKIVDKTAAEILGNPDYLAFSYGGYRHNTRDIVPTVDELKEDLKILSAMDVKLLRTYNTQQYAHAANLLQAIRELKNEDTDFEMYVMLGTWIECEGAWTSTANHEIGNEKNNTAEIEAAVQMANEYPDIVKMIAVGNEAMVQWAVSYFVSPKVIYDWVVYLQNLKTKGGLPEGVWITSSDNYESWGGGNKSYRTADLEKLIHAVDFISLHTYPFHDSHYQPSFWGVPVNEENLLPSQKADAAMSRAVKYAISQYQNTLDYLQGLGVQKPVHIGETGWATVASSLYGANGSQAADEYKEKLYYEQMREWTNKAGISCFYFEAFDENWKDAGNEEGSENHFGLIDRNGQAKYALWDKVDQGVFDGLTRGGKPITKTYHGDKAALMADLLTPPLASEIGILEVSTINQNRAVGELVTEGKYILVSQSLIPDQTNDMTYPSATLKLNAWEGTCSLKLSADGVIDIGTGTGQWWGCALELQSGGVGEDLSAFENGYLNFELKGNTLSSFNLGFQTGVFTDGSQVNNYVTFGSGKAYTVSEDWQSYSIPISELTKGGDLTNVTSLMYWIGDDNFDGNHFYVKNCYYSKK